MATNKNENFTPEKYDVRPGTHDSGKDYEIHNMALLALRCCFQELENFWIASNAEGFGELDDIIMFKKSKESDRGVTYLMQLKHQDDPKELTKDMFLSDKNNFSFKKYCKCYNDIQKIIETDKKHTSEMIAHLKQNHEMVLIILTNRSVANNRTDREFLLKIHETPSIIKDIGCKGDIFRIDYKVLAAEAKINVEFLKRLYLFTNQPHNMCMETEMKNIIKNNRTQKLQLSDVDVSNIILKFIKFIGQWSKGVLDGYYPLTRDNILKKLVELLLFRYMLTIHAETNDEKSDEDNIEENEDYFWYHITQDKDVTVIDDPDDVVEQYVKNITNKIICNKVIFKSITKINRQLMRDARKFKKLSNSERYELLWKTNKIPLLLEVSDEHGVQHIREVFNQFPQVFRVIILNKTKTHLEGFGDVKLFDNVTDLSTQHQEYILNKPIKLQGRELCSIHKLNINRKSFKVKDVVQILCGTFNIGKEFDDTPRFFVEMSLTRPVIDIEILKGSEDIFVVRCDNLDHFEWVMQNQLGIDAENMIRWERLNQTDFNDEIIIFNDMENLEEIEEFCETLSKPVHFLAWYGGYYADLIKSNNINDTLKEHKKNSKKSILAKDFLVNFDEKKQTLIVSAIPGMGKSVLMNYFALNMPIHLWVVDIPLAKYREHYTNWEGQNSDSQQLNFERFLKEVVKVQETPNTEIFNRVFEQFLNSKNVVFLLDGLDEVPVNRQNEAIELIKFINQSGYHMCVTTRPLLQEQLESTFNIFAITLNMFTRNQQTFFLTNYFANVGNIITSNEKVNEFVVKLLIAARSNLNDFDNKFTGVPLQTTLLAEVFANDFVQYLEDGIFKNQHFDLIYLYEHFINIKIKIACAKFENVSESMIDLLKKCRSFYGLLHIFDGEDLQELKIDQKIDVINDMLPDVLQQIQKDGITVIDGDSNVTFVHQTYAEYLVANWLSDNINTSHKETVRKLVQKTFHPNLIVVRNIFDRILASNFPLHIAIVNHQSDKVKTLILDENAFNVTDRGGRTILHFISAWGSHHPDRKTNGYFEIDGIISVLNRIPKNKLKHVEDKLLRHTPLDYAILSRSLRIADFLALAIKNPSCNVNITKVETDFMLEYVNKWGYGIFLYITILKCFIRTDCNKLEMNDIHKRIRNGDLDLVRSLISEKNVDVPDSQGCTLLQAATKGGHKDTVQFLLTMKVDVNQTDQNGRTALHWASYLGHLEIISMLLSNGAEPNVTDCYNLTTYHYAILSSLKNQTNIVSLLLSKNSTQKFDATDKIAYLCRRYKAHPIFLADFVSQKTVLNLILSHQNLDANLKGWMGITPLMLAAKTNDIDSLKLLVDNNVDIDARDYSNQTALHYAAEEGNEKVISILLTNNANVNAKDSNNITPLHSAARRSHQAVVTLLLTNNADVNARDSIKTALHWSIVVGNRGIATILLTNNADVNVRDYNDTTPLHLAAFYGHKDILIDLLAKGADINAQDDRGQTALYCAVEKGREELVNILLDNGADINASNSDKETPLDIAIRKSYQNIVAMLNEAHSKI